MVNSIWGFDSTRSLSNEQRKVLMGNQLEAEVKVMGTCILILNSGFNLYLNTTFYVPSISRNLISLSRLDLDSYSFSFGQSTLSICMNQVLIGGGILYDDLYKLNLDPCSAGFLLTLHDIML